MSSGPNMVVKRDPRLLEPDAGASPQSSLRQVALFRTRRPTGCSGLECGGMERRVGPPAASTGRDHRGYSRPPRPAAAGTRRPDVAAGYRSPVGYTVSTRRRVGSPRRLSRGRRHAVRP